MDRAKSGFNLKIELIDGAAANTNMAISGIATTDELLFVGMLATKASIATEVDDTANCSITSAGNIQTTTNASSNLMRVYWIDNDL